jgi:hypothetical protein
MKVDLAGPTAWHQPFCTLHAGQYAGICPKSIYGVPTRTLLRYCQRILWKTALSNTFSITVPRQSAVSAKGSGGAPHGARCQTGDQKGMML